MALAKATNRNLAGQTSTSGKRKKKHRAAHRDKQRKTETKTKRNTQARSNMDNDERALKKRAKLIQRKLKRDGAKAQSQMKSTHLAATPHELQNTTMSTPNNNGAFGTIITKPFGYDEHVHRPNLQSYPHPPPNHASPPPHATSGDTTLNQPVTERDPTLTLHSDNPAPSASSPPSVLADVPTPTKSSARIKTAAMLHSALRQRSTRLQSQVMALELSLHKARTCLVGKGASRKEAAGANGKTDRERRVEGLEQTIVMATEHLHSIFIMEFALQDILDEAASLPVAEQSAGSMWCEYERLVEDFSGRMRGAMEKISMEAVQRSLANGQVSLPEA